MGFLEASWSRDLGLEGPLGHGALGLEGALAMDQWWLGGRVQRQVVGSHVEGAIGCSGLLLLHRHRGKTRLVQRQREAGNLEEASQRLHNCLTSAAIACIPSTPDRGGGAGGGWRVAGGRAGLPLTCAWGGYHRHRQLCEAEELDEAGQDFSFDLRDRQRHGEAVRQRGQPRGAPASTA